MTCHWGEYCQAEAAQTCGDCQHLVDSAMTAHSMNSFDPCWCLWPRHMLVLVSHIEFFFSVLFFLVFHSYIPKSSDVLGHVMLMFWVRQHSWSKGAKVWDFFQGTWWSNRNHLLVPDRSWQFCATLATHGRFCAISMPLKIQFSFTSLNDSSNESQEVATDFDLRFMGSLCSRVQSLNTSKARWRFNW